MRSVFYKFINFWPTESGKVASEPKPQKTFTPRFKDGGQRRDTRKIHLACWFVHILSTWALNRFHLDTTEFNCLPEEMLEGGGFKSPWDLGLMKANSRQCSTEKHYRHSSSGNAPHGCHTHHFNLASTFKESSQSYGLLPIGWHSHSYHWKRRFN